MNSPGRRALRRQFGALAGACLMNGSVDGALWPRLPQVCQQIVASVDEWALIMTLASVAAVFALVAGSAASARLGARASLAVAGSVYAIAMIAVAPGRGPVEVTLALVTNAGANGDHGVDVAPSITSVDGTGRQ